MKNLVLIFLLSLAAPALAFKIGDQAPDFKLKNADNKFVSLSDYKGKHVVLEWTNKDCPFVKKHYKSGNMQALQKSLTKKGVVWLSVLSSAPGKQGYLDAKSAKAHIKDTNAAPSAFLFDPTGRVGKKLYGAKTTPHMFVINAKGKLVYRGAIDDKRSTDVADIKTAKNYVAAAVTASLAGKKIAEADTDPYGCSVKY